MKALFALLSIVALVAGGAALFAEEGSWTGEVLDLQCYERNGAHGAEHASCAARCLGNGAEVALLIDGEVVKIDAAASDAEAVKTLRGLGGKNAKVSGSASEADGTTTVTVKKAEPAS
ncbi:MAG TPA: hypothetical protein VMV46_08730 [Thermoanaerobaculia bacterium]|nr:hypothetical protein [Thermoanaerobaculia bacterium]